FWATQYHPEYDLHEVARLIIAREEKLVRQGMFLGHEDLVVYVDRLEALAADPGRKDLRWQLGIGDDVLTDEIRQCEFVNWLEKLVLPTAGREG
ncbi:MAG: type 1 glutamine amidotransferase, partial [Candidatus Hydrogenedentes bacterium]|nr:type 1 glutamine amidotransferase [Candidatus Hydrogenedentota bacterium]